MRVRKVDMTRFVALFVSSLLWSICSSAQTPTPAAPGIEAIKTILTSTPTWLLEWKRPDGRILGPARISFRQEGQKFIAILDNPYLGQCSFEVLVNERGASWPGCEPSFQKELTLDATDSKVPFKGRGGPFTYTMRPDTQ